MFYKALSIAGRIKETGDLNNTGKCIRVKTHVIAWFILVNEKYNVRIRVWKTRILKKFLEKTVTIRKLLILEDSKKKTVLHLICFVDFNSNGIHHKIIYYSMEKRGVLYQFYCFFSLGKFLYKDLWFIAMFSGNGRIFKVKGSKCYVIFFMIEYIY